MYPFLFVGLSSNKKSIHPRERLLIFLFHVGHNPTYEVSSYAHDISVGVIHQSVAIVNNALHDYFVPRYLRFPTAKEAEDSAIKFRDEGFPGKIIYGCLDGTHILGRPPEGRNRDKYCNRHGSKSLNVLLYVDAFGIFRYCSANNPGGQHDSAIFHSTKLFEKLQKWKERDLPFKYAVIAADSAFRRNLSILATPFLVAEAEADEMKKQYNEWFCKVRAAIERYIGVLKVANCMLHCV